MAFIVQTKLGKFEIRESRSTPKGPRSRTLASFSELSDAVIEKALSRAENPPSARELKAAALRAGAPVDSPPADRAARDLLVKLARGESPAPMLRRLLLDALDDEPPDSQRDPGSAVSDAARSASEWVGVSAQERGETLRDLLLLTDAVPLRPRQGRIDFPRLRSAPA
jgi:hypothetical protein